MTSVYDITVEELDNISVEKKIQKEQDKFLKKMNRHYHVVPHFNPTTKKSVTLRYYSSGEVGNPIKMAITGSVWNPKYIVGSMAEDLFFKVTIATGETGKELVNIFYENPEQYENHQGILLNGDIKSRWYKKYQNAKKMFGI